MSRVIDERVVSMQFDNKNFESNVKTTINTLDNLKANLKFDNVNKSFSSITAAANQVQLSGISKAVDGISSRFTALNVVGVTTLANIANSAVNAGKRIVSSLTVAPITTGFREYELKMGSIQTIMAGTGESLETVNRYLDELNRYSDQTIYSFQDMTTNIGKFTNAGVSLKDATLAIKGISNEAALSGANTTQASHAMYNFAQALSSGYVKLIDWKSIENAQMATVSFKNELISTAVELGTVTKAGEGMYKTLSGKTFSATQNFNDVLQEQWMTNEVLIKTLSRYADETTEIGKRATAAATEVKTFSMMMDTLRESVQSGWAQSFEIIFGDFEQSKKFWTGLTNFFGGITGSIDAARNQMLTDALGSKWEILSDRISDAGVDVEIFKEELITTAKAHGDNVDKMIEDAGSFEKSLRQGWASSDVIIETLKKMSGATKETGQSTEDLNKKLADFQNVVNRVWKGEFKNAPERYKLLTEAGYDYKKVQDLVNKTVDGHKLTLEDLGEEQLRSIGYTEEEIKSIKSLAREAEKAGTPLHELIQDLTKPSGRELLFESIANAFSPLIALGKAFKEGFADAFSSSGTVLYDFLEIIHSISEYLIVTDETASKLGRTMKGLFAILDLVVNTFGGGFKLGLMVIQEVLNALGYMDVDILSITANIGDMLVAFRDWIENNKYIEKGVQLIAKPIAALIKRIGELAGSIINLSIVQNGIDFLVSSFEKLGEVIDKYFSGGFEAFGEFVERCKDLDAITLDNFVDVVKDFKDNVIGAFANFDGFGDSLRDIGINIVDGLTQGIEDGFEKLKEKASKIAEVILETVKTLLGIHSPSTEFIEIGKNVVIGFCEGVMEVLGAIGAAIGAMVGKIIDSVGKSNLVDLMLVASGLAAGALVGKTLDTLGKFANPFDKLGDMFESFAGIGKSLKKFVDTEIDNRKLIAKSTAILNLAKAIGIVAAALIVLTLVDHTKLLAAGVALAAVVGGLVLLMKQVDKVEQVKPTDLIKLAGVMISLGIAIALMASSIKKLGTMDFGQLLQGLFGLAAIVVAMGGIFYAFGKWASGPADSNISKAGKIFTKFALAMITLGIALKIIGTLSWPAIGKGALIVGGAAVILGVLTAVVKTNGKYADKVGKLFTKFGSAMLLLSIALKIIGGMSLGDIVLGGAIIAITGAVLRELVKTTKYSGTNFDKVGKLFKSFGTSMILLAVALKLMGSLSSADLVKGTAVIVGIGFIFNMLIKTAKSSRKEMTTVGTSILAMSGAIAILALAVRIAGTLSLSDVIKGTAFIIATGAMFKALIAISKSAGEHATKAGIMLMGMSVAIGVLALTARLMRGLTLGDIGKGLAFMTGCIAIFSAIVVISKYAGQNADKAGVMLMKMAVPIAVLAGSIAILSLLDSRKIAVASACLSAVLGMFTLVVKASMGLTNQDKGFVKNLMILTTALGVLSGVIWLLSSMPSDGVLAAGTSLSLLLASLAGSMKILSSFKGFNAGILKPIAIMELAIAGLAVILGALAALDLSLSVENAASLSLLLGTLTLCLGPLAALGAGGPATITAAVTGAAALDAIVLVIGAMVGVVGALSKIPAVGDSIDKGLEVLIKLGSGLGEAIGSFVGGFATGVVSGLPAIGKALGDFMKNIGEVDPGTAQAAKAIAEALLVFTTTGVLDKFMTLFGRINWEELATNFKYFGDALAAYGTSVSGLTPEQIEAIKRSAEAGKAITEVANSVPRSGGWLQQIMGEKDLKDFGKKMKAFGESLVAYTKSVSGLTPEQIESIHTSAEAGMAMTELASTIPAADGWAQTIMGEKDLEDFGKKMKAFGSSIVAYASSVEKVTPEQIEAIKASADAGTAIAKLEGKIPEDGGWVDGILGEQDLKDFGVKMEAFGGSIAAYAKSITELTPEDLEKIKLSGQAAASIAKIEPPDKEAWWNDNTDLETFGTQLTNFGKALVSFSTEIDKIKDTERLKNIANVIKTLSKSFAALSDFNSSTVTGFVNSINTLATANFDGLIKAFEGKAEAIAGIGTDIMKNLVAGFEAEHAQLRTATQEAVGVISSAITSKADTIKKNGTTIVTYISNSIKSEGNKKKIKSSIGTLLNAALDKVNTYKDDFTTAGNNLAAGLSNGIQSKASTQNVVSAASSLGSSVITAINAALGNASPSKKTYQSGIFAGQGLVNALNDYGTKSYNAGRTIADKARLGLSRSIKNISDVLESGVDTQPVIAPVLDLSNVSAGAATIGSMFNLTPSVGVMSKINGINSALNRQNGVNDDVISAINKLESSLGKSGNTYNLNGLSYSEQSDVADAMKVLIRAAKIEGRT